MSIAYKCILYTISDSTLKTEHIRRNAKAKNTMTKKDYLLLAESIRNAKQKEKQLYEMPASKRIYKNGYCADAINIIWRVAYELCLTLKQENERFDTQKFLRACDIK